METFSIIFFIVVAIWLLSKGAEKLIGPLGCLIIALIFIVATCHQYNEDFGEDEKTEEEKLEKLYEENKKMNEDFLRRQQEQGFKRQPRSDR